MPAILKRRNIEKTDSLSRLRAKKKNDCSSLPDINCINHPLPIDSLVTVKYRDLSLRSARIISVKKEGTCNGEIESSCQWKYYVHYIDFNKRMDEWINADRIRSVNTMNDDDSPEFSSKRRVVPTGENKRTSVCSLSSILKDSSNNLSSVCPTTNNSFIDMEHNEHEGLSKTSILQHEELTKVKNVNFVQLGKYKMECWYFCPFPDDYLDSDGLADCLFFCEFTFRFFKSLVEIQRFHATTLQHLTRFPPGNEIYRFENISVFEVDGSFEKIYCQNLCYFAKFFLDHKSLYIDVDPFLFYVLCICDERGYHPVGYFSKEKCSDIGYNLACILTFPSAQRKGYGRFLVSFSYELSKKEKKVGSPEKPLSDLGALSYKSYWSSVIVQVLKGHTDSPSISIYEISELTSIDYLDVWQTLHSLGLLIKEQNEFSNACDCGCDRADRDRDRDREDFLECACACCYKIYAPADVIDALAVLYPLPALDVKSEHLLWTPSHISDSKKSKWISLEHMKEKESSDDKSKSPLRNH